MSEENIRVEAIAKAIRLARELSQAVNAAEALGAILEIDVQVIEVGHTKIKQVLVQPVKL